jgi:hypothetical protein
MRRNVLSISGVLAMFKITHNTARQFSLTEILLMAAMNQMEAKHRRPKCPERGSALERA